MKLSAGRTRSAEVKRWRRGRAEIRAAVADTRLDCVKVTISGLI